MHPGFFRRAPPFLSVASQTGAHHVLPRGGAALRARDDVIEIQIRTGEATPAVLAGVAIARIDVEPTETHVAFRYAIVSNEQDHSRYPHGPIDEPDGLVIDRAGKRRPTLEVEGLVLLVHRASDALVEKRARAPDRSDVDRQVGPVQNQDLGVQYRRGLEEETSAGSSTFGTLAAARRDVKLTGLASAPRRWYLGRLVALDRSRSYTPPPSGLGPFLRHAPAKFGRCDIRTRRVSWAGEPSAGNLRALS
jgi:hypothetical protein